MCKNADNPCPGCKKHDPAEAAWIFFTDEDRAKPAREGQTEGARA